MARALMIGSRAMKRFCNRLTPLKSMKKMFLSAFAVAALLFVGCTNDLTEDNLAGGATAGKPMISSLTANLTSMTRTSLESPEEGKSTSTVWSEGDVIGVVTESGAVRQATLVKGAGTTSAAFDIQGEEGDVYTYAFYPYIYNGNGKCVASNVNGTPETGSIEFNFPVVQFHKEGSVFGENANTMVGAISGESVSLQSVMGALEIRLKGSQTVYGITLKNSNYKHKISGPGTVDLSTMEPTMGTTNASFSYIDLEVPQGVQLNTTTATSFYILVPAGTYENFSVGVITADGSYTRTSTKSHTVSAREILPLNCGNLDEVIDKANAIDLCGGKWANCYIVVPENGQEKTYSFDIKRVDGTVVESSQLVSRYVGEEATYPNCATADEAAPSFAHIVWAEDLGVAYDVHFDKVAGKVYFKNKAVGNARIMLAMNPMAAHTVAGDVLRCDISMIWGWHIWACNEQPKQVMTCEPYTAGTNETVDGKKVYYASREQIIARSKSNPLGFLDRNIGATYAPKSIEEVENMTDQQAADALGLYFQAGNLHPYPRPQKFAVATGGWDGWARAVYQYGFHQYNQSWANSSSAKNSLEDNWNYPYYVYSASHTPNDKYNTTQNRTSWVKMDIRLGGTKDSKDPIALWGGSGPKLNYDPCPKGYKVPHQGNLYQITTGQEFNFTETGATTTVKAKGSTFVFTPAKKVNDQTVGNYITYDGQSIDFHPAGGYGGSGKITWNKTGNLSYLWGSPYASNCEGNATNKAFNSAVKACFASTPSSSNYTGLWPQCATPYQIRCIKE